MVLPNFIRSMTRTIFPENERCPVPLPAYVTDEWLAAQGVTDKRRLLANLRSEDEVMRPERLRAIKATPLSFARSLLQKMVAERWLIEAQSVDVDADGAGTLVYRIVAADRVMTFVVFARRSDGTEYPGRIFEPNFDFLAALFDGDVDAARIEREQQELDGKVWHGRTDNACLGWTLANRSVRFFNHTVERLERGEQPDEEFLKTGGGYLIRNAGWYGNGRFGSRSWKALDSGHPLSYPYHLDIFPLYLWRTVGYDVVEAIARRRNPAAAVPLASRLKAWMGVGNSSGIGMIAALVRWPSWMSAYNFPRELALALVFSQSNAFDAKAAKRFCQLLQRAARYYEEQPDCPIEQVERPTALSAALRRTAHIAKQLQQKHLGRKAGNTNYWKEVADFAQTLGSPELSEQVNALLLETFPRFTDAAMELFPEAMKIERRVDPLIRLGALRSIIAERYSWALRIDQSAPGARAHFWYKSEENGENRRGDREVDPGVDKETFVDVVGAVQALDAALADQPNEKQVAEFLVERPELSHVVSRVQLAQWVPYSEIRGNIIDANFLPMDGIRFLLSTMGLESSHPHSTRWVRGTFLQGAPLPEMIRAGAGDDWLLPALGRSVNALQSAK